MGAEGCFGGIDIGGTKIYAIVTDREGAILASAKKKSKAHQGFETVMERAVSCLKEACDEADVKTGKLAAVGVGAPSPILPDGTAVNAPNMKWFHVPLVPTLHKALGVPVFAENDCNAGALGEYALGAGRGCRSLVGFFVGTGLGGGMVFDGELLRGANLMAAELGHVIVHVGGRRCGCGHNGCLEAYASKTGMARRLAWETLHQGRETMLTELCDGDFASIKSSALREAYRAGDELAVETLHEMADYLGVGVANTITSLGPEVVVLGGGVFEALGEDLLGRVRDAAAAHTHPPDSFADTRILLASLADDAVALGAMVYARAGAEGPDNG
jgi:glucokinase